MIVFHIVQPGLQHLLLLASVSLSSSSDRPIPGALPICYLFIHSWFSEKGSLVVQDYCVVSDDLDHLTPLPPPPKC